VQFLIELPFLEIVMYVDIVKHKNPALFRWWHQENYWFIYSL